MLEAFTSAFDPSGHNRSSGLVVSRATIPHRVWGVFMRRSDFVTIIVAAGILIGQLPVFAQTFRTYRCYDGSQFILALFEGDKRTHLQLDGKAVTLQKRISLSGPRYAKGDISLRITKTGITLKRGKQSTECITRSWVG